MNDILQIAGVPETLRAQCLDNLAIAEEASRGMTWHKLKVRLLRAGKIARMLKWTDNRLIDVAPDLASWDVAPMLNVTAQGDNYAQDESSPREDYWLNPDPRSAEYLLAKTGCYWCPGEHPRSEKSRKAWYRRNGGEYEAWARGWPVSNVGTFQTWEGESGRTKVTAHTCDGAWYIEVRRTYGPFVICGQYGFELANVFQAPGGTRRRQMWWPLPGYELRATVTWSTIPRWKGWND